jgi:S1-C subfamily serine protease
MIPDMSVALMNATVELEQPLPGGNRTVATGFLVSDPLPDGTPRVVLVTANHVFTRMTADLATVGYRGEGPAGTWTYTPTAVPIRSAGRALWTHHPGRDVAVIPIAAPPAMARAAIPLAWLADGETFAQYGLRPGDEMMVLGYPTGLASNSAGFAILRSGRVASYPLSPSDDYPTFLLDFRVFPGNSGGPVYLGEARRPAEGAAGSEAGFVAGMLTQEVTQGAENLGIGVVVQARFIRETIALLDTPAAGGETPPREAAPRAGAP